MLKKLFSQAVCGYLLIILVGKVSAQDTAPVETTGLDEIIVTAQKRDESLRGCSHCHHGNHRRNAQRLSDP